MFNSGALASDLTGVLKMSYPQVTQAFPEKFSLQNQIDDPHDQGNRGICVSVCLTDICKYLNRGTGQTYFHNIDHFYERRQDSSYDGMTVREALEIAQEERLVKSYAILGSSRAIQYAIMANGPVIICLPVYNSLVNDFWYTTGKHKLEGLHAVTFVGFEKEDFILRNSWGYDYGENGYWYFPQSHLNIIMEAWTVFS